MNICKATIENLPEILKLQQLCYTENAERYNDYSIAPLSQTIQELQEEFKTNTILQVIDDNEVVGSIRAFEKNGTCFIGRVIVHPRYQNKGIGALLMNAIEKEFCTVNRFELFTGNRDNKNLYFYNKLGFRVFKNVKVDEALTMVYLDKHNNKTQ